MQETSELRTVIESLYEIFATYPLRADTNACACCHSAYDAQRLHMKPLRKLNADDLRQYAGDALFVWGEVDDFKHFLPRIFELEVAHGDSFVDPQPPEFNVMEIEDWLCGIAQAEAQLSPYLGKWLATETDNARLNLAAFKVTLISRSRTDVLATTGTTAPNYSMRLRRGYAVKPLRGHAGLV